MCLDYNVWVNLEVWNEKYYFFVVNENHSQILSIQNEYCFH